MPSYPCSDFHLENPWMMYPPLVLAIPTLVLNIILVQLVLMKKEFDHMFYRLLCVFSLSSCIKRFQTLLLITFTRTEFACNAFYGTFLNYNRLILFLTVPNIFLYFSPLLIGILLALNRVTTAMSPVAAKKFWHNNERIISLITLMLVVCQSIPYCWSYAYLHPKTGLSTKSSIQFDGFLHQTIFNILTVVLISLLAAITIYTKTVNQEIAKYANERNMLYTGLVLAVISGIGPTINVLSFFKFVDRQLGDHVQGYLRLVPVYVILAMDPVIRDFVLNYLRLKKSPSSTVQVLTAGSTQQ